MAIGERIWVCWDVKTIHEEYSEDDFGDWYREDCSSNWRIFRFGGDPDGFGHPDSCNNASFLAPESMGAWAYVVVCHYSDGNTFGRSAGQTTPLAVFASHSEANANLAELKKAAVARFGFFESLEDMSIEHAPVHS